MAPRPLKPLPRNLVEVEQAQLNPYYQEKPSSSEGTVFSHNRAEDLSRKNDNIKDISVGLEDMDNAVQYYFDNVIKPTVIQNNTRIAVPVIYGDAEKWKSVQNDGFYRDQKGKIMVPLIMYKRTNLEKNRSLGNNLDGNKTHLFNVFETRYNRKNQYDNFSVLTNRTPSKQYYVTVVPDYVTVTYECIIFTNFVEQNNKLIEAIEFASDAYWGDFKRWHFRTKIDTFAVTNVIEQDADRAAKTSFTMTLNGYLVSDNINVQAATANMFYSPAQIVFGLETTDNVTENFVAPSQIAASQGGGNTSFVGGGVNNTNVNTTNIYYGASVDLLYLDTNKTKVADTISSNTAIFTGAQVLQPSSGSTLPATSISNFTIVVNGQYIPATYLTLTSGSNAIFTFDTGSLGWSLLSSDIITATGKFQ